MNAVVVYDSWYGNTARIAAAIAERLGPARLVRAKKLGAPDLTGCDLLVIGSPTHAAGPSIRMRLTAPRIPADVVRGLPVATFDTRFHGGVGATGSAAMKLARRLEMKGAWLVVPPESFFVQATKGPLDNGEIERAKAWADTLRQQVEARRGPAISA